MSKVSQCTIEWFSISTHNTVYNVRKILEVIFLVVFWCGPRPQV